MIMYQIDFQKPQAVHFIGIGGISMSGLAEILLDEGFQVSGSDAQKSALTEHLEQKGAKIFIGQRASNIEEGMEVVGAVIQRQYMKTIRSLHVQKNGRFPCCPGQSCWEK